MVFALLWDVFSKLALVFEETTGRLEKVTARLRDFVGSFSNSFPWNFFSSLGILQTSGEIGILSEKIGAFFPFPHFLFKKEEKERGKNTRSFF